MTLPGHTPAGWPMRIHLVGCSEGEWRLNAPVERLVRQVTLPFSPSTHDRAAGERPAEDFDTFPPRRLASSHTSPGATKTGNQSLTRAPPHSPSLAVLYSAGQRHATEESPRSD